jgi:hypothetical protein
LLTLISFSLWQSRPKQEVPSQQKSDETKNIPSVTQAQPPSQHNDRNAEKQAPKTPMPIWTDPFWSNWALVVVGIITAWVALGTLRDLKKQTAATGISAEAAKKSAEIAEASLKIVERADILLDAASLVYGQIPGGKDARVILQYKNFGRTKAVEVRLRLNLIIKGIPESDHTKIPTIVMGAGETKEASSQRFVEFMTEDTAQEIFSGKTGLSFEGGASYEDIFGNPHHCFYTGTWDKGTNMFHIEKQESD